MTSFHCWRPAVRLALLRVPNTTPYALIYDRYTEVKYKIWEVNEIIKHATQISHKNSAVILETNITLYQFTIVEILTVLRKVLQSSLM